MFLTKKYFVPFLCITLALCLAWILNVSSGSVAIPFEALLSSFVGKPLEVPSWEYIIWNYRIPKSFTAILVGGGLSLSGLLMQTLFRNPLAGPFVLGISFGASLGAALFIMGSSVLSGLISFSFFNDVSLALAASLGSFLVLMVVILVAHRVKDTMTLLVIGLMFGSITSAIVSVLSYFSSADNLQRFTFWSFGSVGNLSQPQVLLLFGIVVLGMVLSIFSIKALNAFLLGENYAESLGISIKKSRFMIITATGLLAGGITAFAGPIAFVGLAVPHLTRQIFDTMEHRILIPAVFLYGAILLLLCDTIAQWPSSANILPINAVTTLVGAPVVIWLLLRKRKLIF